jgi:hypothetical protein
MRKFWGSQVQGEPLTGVLSVRSIEEKLTQVYLLTMLTILPTFIVDLKTAVQTEGGKMGARPGLRFLAQTFSAYLFLIYVGNAVFAADSSPVVRGETPPKKPRTSATSATYFLRVP